MKYRGHEIYAVFDGYRIEYPGGATSPEKYQSPDHAMRSIDFDLKKSRRPQ